MATSWNLEKKPLETHTHNQCGETVGASRYLEHGNVGHRVLRRWQDRPQGYQARTDPICLENGKAGFHRVEDIESLQYWHLRWVPRGRSAS